MTSQLIRAFTLTLIATVGMSQPGRAQEGVSQGIKVHGRWTIDVRNADGTLASHHEFENALDSSAIGGSATLAAVLGRLVTTGTWSIVLDGIPSGGFSGPCQGFCVITEDVPTAQPGSFRYWRTLRVDVPTTTAFGVSVPTGTIHLSGHATMANAQPITFVSTRLTVCPSTSDPGGCSSGGPVLLEFGFTRHTLGTPVQVDAGQIVQVRVVISFS